MLCKDDNGDYGGKYIYNFGFLWWGFKFYNPSSDSTGTDKLVLFIEKINDETFKIRFITWIWQEICVPGDTCQSGFRALSFKNNTKNGDVNSFNINYNKGGVTQISLVLQKISARNYNLTLTYGTTTIKCIATDVDNGHRARVDGDYTGYNYGGRKTRRNKKRRHKTARKRRSYRSKIYY